MERDGTDIGSTPLTDSMPYSGTPLAYRISAAGYTTYETAVTPDHRRTLNISLKQSTKPALTPKPLTPVAPATKPAAPTAPKGGAPSMSLKGPVGPH